MTLYLSQKALFYLLLGAFCLGGSAAVLYEISSIVTKRTPKRRIGRIALQVFLQSRDFLLFVLLGIADAILLFVYQSGRVRLSVFLMNFCGFLITRQAFSWLASKIFRHFTKKLWRSVQNDRSQDVV